jgi:hypothetical protein
LGEQENSEKKLTQTLLIEKFCKSQGQKLPFSTRIPGGEQPFRVLNGAFLNLGAAANPFQPQEHHGRGKAPGRWREPD